MNLTDACRPACSIHLRMKTASASASPSTDQKRRRASSPLAAIRL
jgi:hypothetical protein